jgi:hypothetical protein
MPEERFGNQAAVIDPEGADPRVYFPRVPEDKTAKNRVPLDARAAVPKVRGRNARRIEEQVARLTGAGASIAWRENDIRANSVVMRDPEGEWREFRWDARITPRNPRFQR